jgi:uncharacterized protein YndB with AHSA1/START domain
MISIKKELTVETSQETAFRVFSQKMDLWWPRSHHVGKTPMRKMVLEPKAKGRWYSTHEGGEECEVGFVQTFDPHARLVLVWQLNGEFRHDADLHTEVEVNFIVQGPQQTLVTFEHRDVDRLGKAVDGMSQGWGMILDLYAQLAKAGKLEGEALQLYQRRTVG